MEQDRGRTPAATPSAELLAKLDPEASTRENIGFWRYPVLLLAAGLSIFHMYTAGFGLLPPELQRAPHLGIGLILAFLLYPARRGKREATGIPFTDVVLAVLSLVVSLYHIVYYEQLLYRAGRYLPQDFVIAAIAIVLVLEASRRAVGWPLTLVAAAAVFYAYLGPYMPGFLHHRGFSIRRIISHLYLTTEGILGIPIGVSASFIFLFLLFGAVLQRSGIGDFFNDLAISLTGRSVGGPAKAAVVASALQGTISGSSVANTVGSGSFTIPLMKRIGYKPEFAAAVEASASTGGQLMPPIMGAAAFIMTEFTGIPYIEIAKAAAIPAVLYFTGIFVGVHQQSKKDGLKGMPASELPRFFGILRTQGYLVLPLVVIVGILLQGKTPMNAAFWGIITAFAVAVIEGLFKPERRMTLRRTLEILEAGARSAVPIIAASAAAGIIVGIVGLTGVGLKLAGAIIAMAQGKLMLTMLFTMIACLVLGMGLPTTANYIVTATMAAPALLGLDVPVIAAHLFVFYFGIIADITPPVSVAAYAGAGIAGANPFRTGVTAVKLAVGAFLVPYIFALSPSLVLVGASGLTVAISTLTAVIGMTAVSAAMVGYFSRDCSIWERAVLLAGGIMLISPERITDVTGIVLLLAVYAYQSVLNRREAAGTTAV